MQTFSVDILEEFVFVQFINACSHDEKVPKIFEGKLKDFFEECLNLTGSKTDNIWSIVKE